MTLGVSVIDHGFFNNVTADRGDIYVNTDRRNVIYQF